MINKLDSSPETPIECRIKITSRHIVHNAERFARYGIVPSFFSSNDPVGGDADPEDFPEEMLDALDEILRLEHERHGAPEMVIDPYAPPETDEDDVSDGLDGEDDDISDDEVEDLNRKLELLLKLFADPDDEDDSIIFETSGTIERCVRTGRDVIEIKYVEDASMDGTDTVIRYDVNNPGYLTISHSGGVISTLICERGVRHISVYNTPIMPFEIAVYAKKCDGFMTLDGGVLVLDYMLELRGADLQRTIMTIEVEPMRGYTL